MMKHSCWRFLVVALSTTTTTARTCIGAAADVVGEPANDDDDNNDYEGIPIISTPLYSPYRRRRRKDVSWNCDIYMAPSSINDDDSGGGGDAGWGVFAGRDFRQGEIVEIAPRFLPLPKNQLLKQTILNDYYYKFHWRLHLGDERFGVIAMGATLFYNHGEGELQNVKFQGWGREPHSQSITSLTALGLGYAALRDIKRGEELLATYGGEEWFIGRGLKMQIPKESPKIIDDDQLREQFETKYCSKAISGIGHPTWYKMNLKGSHDNNNGINNPHDFLPLQDHPTAKAKTNISQGEVIEYSPALILPLDKVINTSLETICFRWNDWSLRQKESIVSLRQQGKFRCKTTTAINNNNPQTTGKLLLQNDNDDDNRPLHQIVIFPVGGNIGLVRKVGRRNQQQSSNSNCRIEIVISSAVVVEGEDDEHVVKPDGSSTSSLILKLIATKDLKEGEELKLDMPDKQRSKTSWFSKSKLLQQLALTGQPIPTYLADLTYYADAGFATDSLFPIRDSNQDDDNDGMTKTVVNVTVAGKVAGSSSQQDPTSSINEKGKRNHNDDDEL